MDRYEKLRTIGRGAFGIVYLVKRKGDERLVVIKQIPVDDLGKEERFSAMNEVKVLSMLKHPNIIAYYDNFVEEKSLWIVMEYAPGETLHRFIEERNMQLMDEDHILLFFVQLLVAIDHVHKLNILHRDLKTQNVMFNRKRNILKIGDFGISKVLSSKITSAKTVVGTPCYISPEICEGKMYATKSDIWALGCILYELTTLQKAFEGPNLPALVMKIMQANSNLQPIDSAYSTGLRDLIYLTLHRNPDDRPNVQKILSTPIIVNSHLNLSTDVGRLPCSKLDPNTNSPITCTRMSSKGDYMTTHYLVDEYSPPGGVCDAEKSPKPVIYLWGGGVTTPMMLELPAELIESKTESVACGRTQRMAVTDDGKVISWKVSAGSLGTTQFTTTMKGGVGGGRTRKRDVLQLEPMLVSGLKTIKKVACGDMFTACLTDRGILMTFGSGTNGALGHGNYKDMEKPEMVTSMLEYETTEIACGAHHVIAITAEGEVFAWGEGDRGQLGLGDNMEKTATPTRVRFPPGTSSPVAICCGSDCSIVITESGQMLASGVNKHNKLILDNEEDATPTSDTSTDATPSNPQASMTDSGVSMGTGSSTYSSASSFISKDGGGIQAIMKSIRRPPDKSFLEMTMSGRREKLGAEFDEHAAAELTTPSLPPLMQSSVLPPTTRSNRPKWKVLSVCRFTLTGSKLIRERHIAAVSLGINHSALLTVSGEVLTCGDNVAGQLGYPKTTPTPDKMTYSDRAPQTVMALQDLEVIKVTCGDFYSIATCKDGTLYSWGRGRSGRLGKATEANVSVPEKIPFELSSHKLLSMSSSHGVTMMTTVPPM